MKIGKKEYAQIVVTNKQGEVLSVISDEKIIEQDGYKVRLDESA